MPFNLDQANQTAAALDAALKPIANRPVDITRPGWVSELKSRPKPLDEAGVRQEAEALLGVLLDAYASEGEVVRAAIRELFARNRAFAWATGLSDPPTTEHNFRRHLLRIAAENGGTDLRDVILLLDYLCVKAREAGVDIGPVLDEVAAISSDQVLYGMASIRSLLSGARQRHAS